MPQGQFITVEGIEGVGKSTQVQFIHDYLNKRKLNVVLSREPGGTPIAEDIRHLLLNNHDEPLTSTAETLLLFAGRAQHIATLIKPSLEQGQWVLCDRFTDASYAYQGGGRGIDRQVLKQLEEWVLGDLRPNLTLLLDAPVETGRGRIVKRGNLDRIEQERAQFFQAVRDAYLERAEQYPERFVIIGATQTIAEVEQQIVSVLEQRFFGGE